MRKYAPKAAADARSSLEPTWGEFACPPPQLTDQPTRYLVNKVPTSFNLTDEQVEAMKKAGRDLLRANPEFQRMLKDMAATSGS